MSDFSWNVGPFQLDLKYLWSHPSGPTPGSVDAELAKKADAQMREKFSSKQVGFYDLPTQPAKEEWRRMQEASQNVREEFDAAVICGIGGSHLGGASVLQALRDPEDEELFPIWWLTNIDATSVRRAVRFQQSRYAATVLISKSGGTVETLAGFSHLSHDVEKNGIFAITDPETGDLRRMVKQNGWPAFDVPKNVGGRFSVLTAVGLFPALLGHVDAAGLLEGARTMRDVLERSRDPLENPAYSFATAAYLWDTKHGHKLHYLMPYQAELRLFADWFVQLWGESLGKRLLANPTAAVGPTPVAALGTTDQHSLLQLFKEGPRDKIVGFLNATPAGGPLKVGECAYDLGENRYLAKHTFQEISQKASLATQTSLHNAEVPTYRIEVPQLTAQSLGALLFFFETACAYSGELYGVDAYTQPGVEDSKRLLRASL